MWIFHSDLKIYHCKYDYEKACLISLRNVACHSIGITCCELILILYPQSETLNSCELMTTEIQGLYYLLQLSLLLLQVQILQLKQKIVTSQKKVMALFASTVPNRLISLLCWGTPFKQAYQVTLMKRYNEAQKKRLIRDNI